MITPDDYQDFELIPDDEPAPSGQPRTYLPRKPAAPRKPLGTGEGLWIIILTVGLTLIAAACGCWYVWHSAQLKKEEKARALTTLAHDKAEADQAASMKVYDKKQQEKSRKAFLNNLVLAGTFLEAYEATRYPPIKTISLRSDIPARLKKLGYGLEESAHLGAYHAQRRLTYYKEWNGSDHTLWSRVIYVDSASPMYIIEFCDQNQYNRFVRSCKNLGFETSSFNKNILVYQMEANRYHDCTISLSHLKATINP